MSDSERRHRKAEEGDGNSHLQMVQGELSGQVKQCQ